MPQRIGPWRVEREIARGGMGVVFQARDPAGRPVALKLHLPGANAERAAREGRALARLRHPNVVALLDAGVDQGRLYLVMELIEGESLLARLERSGPLEVREALALGRDLAGALAAAHAQGILHRDLKPANVLLAREGRVCLSDFGLARLEEEAGLSRSGQMLGTPGFWPPEQALGDRRRIGPASDVYGLGATLYAALTGEPPCDGESEVEALRAVVDRPPEPPSSLRPGVPPAVDALLLRCLEKDPAARPASADELRALLDACLQGSGSPQREGRRGRAGLVLAAALLASAGLGGAAVVLQLRRRPTPPPASTTARPAGAPDTAAKALIDARRWKEAEALLVPWLEAHPDDAISWARLGYARQLRGVWSEAEVACRRAVQLDPRSTFAHGHLGTVLLRQGRYHEAVAELDAAHALDPGALDIVDQRAVARDGLGDLQGALRDYTWVLERGPARLVTLINRARTRARLGDHAGALEDLERAHRLDPGEATIVERRAQILSASGDVRGALAALDAYPASEVPVQVGFSVQRAGLHLYLGEFAAARDAAELALRLEVESPGAPQRWGIIVQAAGLRAFAAWHLGDTAMALRNLALGEKLRPPSLELLAWREALARETPPTSADPCPETWPGPLLAHLRGELSREQLLQRAGDAGTRCDADGLLGLLAEQRGEQDEARRRYEAAFRSGEDTRLSYAWARTRLQVAGR